MLSLRRFGPGGMTARLESSAEPLMASWKASILRSASASRSPNATTSTAMLLFFSRFASLTHVFSSSDSGLHVKTMMRWCCDLFWRCLSASCAREG